jgi:Flp pilus assembly pilin Flp
MLKLYTTLLSRLETLRDREEGQGMIEYTLLAALISVVAIASITAVGLSVDTLFQAVDTALP